MTLDLAIEVPVDSSAQLHHSYFRTWLYSELHALRASDERGFANRLIMTELNQAFRGPLHCSGEIQYDL